MPILKVKLFPGEKRYDDSILPRYAKVGDAALDLFSCEDIRLPPESVTPVHTGIATEFEPGWVMLYRGRSGLAMKGINVLAGVIDSSYRGEHIVLLHNTKKQSYFVNAGDRIAQALLIEAPHVTVLAVDELSDSERGADGFGSTGK